MKKRVPLDVLNLHDVPEELDRRILLQASFCARRKQRRRQFCRIAAAAAVLFVSGAVFIGYRAHPERIPEQNLLSQSELLRLGDWSELEQENYNIGLQINSDRQAFAELAVNHL